MDITKKTIEITQQRVIKPARIEEIDSGNKRETKTIKQDGTEVVELVPIMQRVFFEPIVEDVKTQKEVYVVKTVARVAQGGTIKTKGGLLVQEIEEEHEFATPEEAERFITEYNEEKRSRHDMLQLQAMLRGE